MEPASRKKARLVAKLAVVAVGLVTLVIMMVLNQRGQSDFAPKTFTARLEPIMPSEIKPAEALARKMGASELVLAVTIGGEARAYPLNMLAGPSPLVRNNHELVNDHLGGQAILITWCDLCHTGIVYQREVDGRELLFGITGQLWKSNLVMYDRETGTLWSQFLGEAELGRLKGVRLRKMPSVKTDWRTWYARYPNGTVAVLGRNSRNYRAEFYDDIRLELVLGIASGEKAKAWRLKRVLKDRLLNDDFDNRPVVVLGEPESYTAVLYARTVQGEVLTFHPSGEKIVDDQTESTWDLLTGRALTGPLAGKSLTPLPATVSLEDPWLAFHPESEVVR
jgi:hypothetical protein